MHPSTLRRTASLATAAVLALALCATPATARPSGAARHSRVWSAGSSADTAARTEARAAAASDRYIVGYQRVAPAASAAAANAAVTRLGGSVLRDARSDGFSVVRVPKGSSPATWAATLRKQPGVRYVEHDAVKTVQWVPNDPLYPQQWGLARVGATLGWDYGTGSSNVEIAVLDTGITDHPDLTGHIDWANGWDFANDDSDPTDDHGHGTHVSGIAAASTGNGAFGAGVAGGATILPYKVMDANGQGDDSVIAVAVYRAVDFALSSGKRVVINMSLGGGDYTQTFAEACAYARANGVFIAAAAGNEGQHLAEYYPAAYPGVTAVAAVEPDDRLVTLSSTGGLWGSNTGPYVDLAAPGDAILSTTMDGSTAAWGGTSMATPFVAGAAALLLSRQPTLTAAQVEAQLEARSVDLGARGRDDSYGVGRLDVSRLMGVTDAFEPDASLATAKWLGVAGAPVPHVFSPTGESDWHYISTVPNALYRAQTTGLHDGADTYLQAYAAGSKLLGANDDRKTGDPSSSLLFRVPAVGRTYLRVWDAFRVGGGYRVSVARAPDDAYEPDSARTQARVNRTGYNYYHLFAPLGESDWIKVAVTKGRTYKVGTSQLRNGADTYLQLANAAGTVFASNDDAGSTLASAVTWRATYTGWLYARVWDRYGLGGGYRVTTTLK